MKGVEVVGLIRKGPGPKEGEVWYAITLDEVPGLYLAGPSLSALLSDVVPSWRKLHEIAPTQVPDPDRDGRKKP